MEKFTTDELRRIKGMAEEMYFRYATKDREKALKYSKIGSKTQNEIMHRNRNKGKKAID